MIFNIKYKPYRGYRIKKRFAFFPMYLENNQYIWLESYYSLQKHSRMNLGGSVSSHWYTHLRHKSLFGFRKFLKTEKLNTNKYRENRDRERRVQDTARFFTKMEQFLK